VGARHCGARIRVLLRLGGPQQTRPSVRDFLPDDALVEWIAELRDRLKRGDLAKLGPIDIGYGTYNLPAARTIQIMLGDLDDFEDMTPDEANEPANVERRASLRADFRALRFLID
jgi:hypothetical protein